MTGRAAAAVAGWGLFGACSWTWCIGMWLPGLMLDRYGLWGVVAFAVPNVLGCTAFGYVLGTPARSRALVHRHPLATAAFSFATVGYHLLFASLVAIVLGGGPLAGLVVAAALLAVGVALAGAPDRAWPWLAAGVYALSLLAFAAVELDVLRALPPHGAEPPARLAWLVPTLCFGFLLCPYLDLTFHRMLQASPSRHAFAIFGAAFAVMIVLTCAYRARPDAPLPGLVLAHLAAQSEFTVAAHARELHRRAADRARPPLASVALAVLAGLAAALPLISGGTRAAAETAYLRYLVAYGLIAPAVVALLVIRPRRDGTSGLALVLVVLLSLPLYEVGFVHGMTWLLPIPLLALVVARAWPRGATAASASAPRA